MQTEERERERQRQTDRQTESEREKERELDGGWTEKKMSAVIIVALILNQKTPPKTEENAKRRRERYRQTDRQTETESERERERVSWTGARPKKKMTSVILTVVLIMVSMLEQSPLCQIRCCSAAVTASIGL